MIRETYYEPTDDDLKDYSKHCQKEKTMTSDDYFNEFLDDASTSDQPHPSTMYQIASHIFLTLFPSASLKFFARNWLAWLESNLKGRNGTLYPVVASSVT